MKLLRLRTAQAGDTIIEVLISISVIALVMGMAYGTAARALSTTRSSQERLEALKLAEGQIERIKASDKAARALSLAAPIYTPAKFYVDQDVNVVTTTPVQVNTFYNVEVTRSNCAGADLSYKCHQFDVVVTWERVGTGEQQAVKLSYRLYAL